MASNSPHEFRNPTCLERIAFKSVGFGDAHDSSATFDNVRLTSRRVG